MGQLLSHPLTEKYLEYNDYKHVSQDQTSNITSADGNLVPHFYNCVGSMQGYRLTQEDAHLVLNEDKAIHVKFYDPFKNKMEQLKLSIFSLFDGHGGADCSNFLSGGHQHSAKKGIARWIAYSFERHQYGAYLDNDSDSLRPPNSKRAFRTLQGLITQVIKDAFMLQDQELYQHFANSSCGSTAVVAIIINNEFLYVANCGDSRCILSSKNLGIKTMSYDHKPQHIGELLRINDNGGTVSLGRVGGVLALSRAFSDFQFKRGVNYGKNKGHHQNAGIPPQEAQVTAEPDVLMHKIDFTKDEFLVLGCDGIWDIYSNKQLVQFIKYHLTLGVNLPGIITKLLDHGIAQANSNTGVGFDNMTAILVVLNNGGESLQDWYTKMKVRLERERGLQ
ncbi:hypothetical protein HG535_0A01960 [Zygotorulaspora mrakii]|uniref:protein-serine/threonine phosphatase n=1 Tax=Zygotorulaspora mrakii TaxID=42260 RepID=A0A7H9AVA2_ZYGMR|nr:uncharacterized protein HG535_0A01960 [Zygotorulaspora mrakii]QLG70258.1 hypothetical protein HG535_0A01960 [Zygotorulaspora mrakii]